MRLVVGLLAALLALPAAAQRADSPLADGWLGDEPDVREPGRLPHAGDDPSASYPADANGVAEARAGAPSSVLAARLHARAAFPPAPVAPLALDLGGWMARSGLAPLLAPGLAQLVAWHGAWADADGDGWIGEGEWSGTSGAALVAYVTPGRPSSAAHRPFGAEPDDPQTPDWTLREGAGGPAGRYFGPAHGWDVLLVDNGLVQTTAVEVLSAPVLVVGGARTHEAGPSSLVEVDVHRSADPTVEALYAASVVPLARDAGCSEDYPEHCARDPAGAAAPAHPVVGPVAASFLEPVRPEAAGGCFACGPRPYLDLQLHASTEVDLVTTHLFLGRDLRDVAWTGDGLARPFGQLQLVARLGVWHDLDGDGWIGSPKASPGCPTPHDCGATQDPNAYTLQGSGGEFTPACAPPQAEGPADLHPFLAALAPAGGRWGAGAYVVADRADAVRGGDPYREGRAGDSPYDDAVVDLADGRADRLVREGPVALHMLCRDADGEAWSYERVLLPAGNPGFDVVASATVELEYVVDGVLRREAVEDVDVHPAWGAPGA